MNPLKPGLEVPTERIAALPVAKNGYPVPWFVAWVNGEPEFRAADDGKFIQAVKLSLCWVCGQKLGRHKTFVVGPMCGVTRTSAEPPVHHDCAHWSVRNCPFLNNPKTVRREKGIEDAENPGGIMIKRNPGVMLLWTTTSYKVISDGQGGRLIKVDDPHEIEWFSQGRKATREEIEAGIESGLPALMTVAREDGDKSVDELLKAVEVFKKLCVTD